METFETKALQLAIDLTHHNTYEGKVGQGYVEARAADIRRTFNILCGHDPEGQPTRKGPGKRKGGRAAEGPEEEGTF